MKIEKFNAPKNDKPEVTFASQLRALKTGEAIRLKTAAEWRNASSSLTIVGKKLGVKFSSTEDGDDVLVFIKK